MKKITVSVLSFILLFTSVVLGAGFLTGCSLGGKSSSEPVTLTIWHVYGAQTDSPLNDLIDEFNSTVGKEEGIQVEVTMVSNNKSIHEHILAAANGEPGSSELPDIFCSYPKTVLALPDDDILVDYRDYFTDEELGKHNENFLSEGIIDGRQLILPMAKSTEVTIVNKTLFDRFADATGTKLSDLTTWESLFKTSEKYAKWSGGKSFLVQDFHFNYFQVGTESLGEDFFNETGDGLAFGPAFEKVWEPYARTAVKGGLWLKGGYATEPIRTADAIVSVVSSASILYYSDEVTYSDNTSEKVEYIALPAPVFENGQKLVMQRGGGLCLTKSTPEREKAAVTFLKWLTAPEVNTRFALQAGYMPVTDEAFNDYMPKAIEELTDPAYKSLYDAFLRTYDEYTFYHAPQLEQYLEMETSFEDSVRLCMQDARYRYIESGGSENVDKLISESLNDFKKTFED